LLGTAYPRGGGTLNLKRNHGADGAYDERFDLPNTFKIEVEGHNFKKNAARLNAAG
jgi:hypothetical protein